MALKILNMSHFRWIYLLDCIVNLCTKFEMLSFTQSTFSERVQKYKWWSRDPDHASENALSLHVGKIIWATPLFFSQIGHWKNGKTWSWPLTSKLVCESHVISVVFQSILKTDCRTDGVQCLMQPSSGRVARLLREKLSSRCFAVCYTPDLHRDGTLCRSGINNFLKIALFFSWAMSLK